MYQYNNIELVLNDFVKEKCGISTARSVKIEDIEKLSTIDKGERYGKEYTYDSETYKHTYYEGEFDKNKIGILAENRYWLASACNDYDSKAFGVVRYMNNGKLSGYEICYLSGARLAVSITCWVRAIVYI